MAHVGVENAICVLGGLGGFIDAWFANLVKVPMSHMLTYLTSTTDSLDPFFLVSSGLKDLPALFGANVDPAWSGLGVNIVFQDILRCLALKILRQVINGVRVIIIIVQTLKFSHHSGMLTLFIIETVPE